MQKHRAFIYFSDSDIAWHLAITTIYFPLPSGDLTVPILRPILCLLLVVPFVLAQENVPTYGPYFESNRSGLKGDASYLVFRDAKKFDAVLKLVPPVGGRRPVAVPTDAFAKSLVLSVIRRGPTTYTYEGVLSEEKAGVLTLTFKSAPVGAPSTAQFATPLVVVLPKGAAKSVEFVENGKKVETIKLD